MNNLPQYSFLLAGFGLALTSLPALGGGEKNVIIPPSGSVWRLSAGPMARHVEGADFSVGSVAGSGALPTPFGNGYFNLPSSIGGEEVNADRTYDDGYVNRDLVVPNDSHTPYWGYDNNSQYSGGFGGTMVMSVSPSSPLAGSSRYVDSFSESSNVKDSGSDETEFGFRVELDRMTTRDGGWSMGPVLGCSIFSGGSSVGGISAFSGWASADDYAVGAQDTYQLGSSVQPPSAAYAHNGQGPGALIPNQPDLRTTSEEFVDSHYASYSSPAEVELDLFVLSLDLGYRVERQWDRFSVNGSLGVSVNIVPWDADHKENATQTILGGGPTTYSSSEIDNDGTEFLVGGYLQGGVAYDITESLSLGGFGRYDFIQSFDDEVGPSSFDQDLSGWSAGLMLTKRF